jgi:uncharacterized protein (DUF58 family)
MRGVRPQRVSRRALVLVVLAAAFFMISRTTGSGWVVVLVCGVLAVLAAAAAAPAIGLARVEISVRAPRDATVGRVARLRVSVRRGRGLRLRVVDPPGEWLAADAPADGEVLVRPTRRGVFGEIEVDVATAGPLGLIWWRRRLCLALPEPVEVGPRLLEVPLATAVPAAATGIEASPRARLGHESVRSVREYVPGDPVRLVHWPATAHWGDLMVKELETSDAPRLVIVVDLRGPETAAELAASRAAGLARAAFRARLTVGMLTAERRGPVAGEVAGAADAGRRLARAVAGAPTDGPLPPGAAVVWVTARGGPEQRREGR